MRTPSPQRVCGADGCPSGWIIVWFGDGDISGVGIAPDFSALVAMTAGAAIVAVDIPIGLATKAEPGGRECDRIVRKRLKGRASCVFPPPAYAALAEETYTAAVEANRASSPHQLGISKQCFALFRRLRNVHDTMTPALQERIREVHPELCFQKMAHDRPLSHSKHTTGGLNERLELLRAAGISSPERSLARFTKSTVAPDDVLDAMAAAWTARRIATGTADHIPANPERDARGLRMEMWV